VKRHIMEFRQPNRQLSKSAQIQGRDLALIDEAADELMAEVEDLLRYQCIETPEQGLPRNSD
jgi:hypothetical protein